jgi:hypothetical protein
MKNSRRNFFKYAGIAGLGMAVSKITEGFTKVSSNIFLHTPLQLNLLSI